MAIPDYQALMLPVLRLAATGVTRVPDAAAAIADRNGGKRASEETGEQALRQIRWAAVLLDRSTWPGQPL